jgi:predicted Zn-dependent peptidase
MTPTAREQRLGSTRTLLRASQGGLVRRTVLPGGLRVVTEQMPGVRSVSFGIWVGVGSRDETPKQMGAAHYLEHALFKGTARREALDISSPIDAVGGEMNAFTAKEYTCYYARVLDDDLPLAVDIVSDIVTSALIRDVDVEAERGVIFEEIAMRDDDPSDLVHDEFAAALWGDTPLGRSILGTQGTIEALTPTNVRAFYRRRYTADNMVVAVAGNVEHTAVVRMVRKAFDTAGALGPAERGPAAIRGSHPGRRHTGQVKVVGKRTEQANIVLGVPGLPRDDDRRFALGVLSAALGGGMSSRLFQEVREKRGLAYSVYSFASHYADSGQFGVYAGCLPSKIDEVLALCRDQLAQVSAAGITDDEIARGKGQLRGSVVLGLEDTGSRMTRIGKSELVTGELLAIDEILRRIESVTPDDVRAVAATLLAVPISLAVIGPFDGDRDFSSAIA